MLSIDGTLVVSFLIIWILLLVLSKLFFNPVRKIMEEREAKIQDSRGACKKALETYEQNLHEIEARLKSGRAEAELIREEFEMEALKEKSRLLEEINTEYRSQMERAKTELNEAMKDLKKELKSEALILAERIEQRLLH